jgi:hypothetical protein
MTDRKTTDKVTLNDSDMVSGRRAAMKSMLAKTGLAVGVIATAVAAASTSAHASDRRNQTDHDTGRGSDEVGQTDND